MKTILAIIAGVITLVTLILKRGENYARVIEDQLDKVDEQINRWKRKRDEALDTDDEDMLTVVHSELIRLHTRKDALLQRRREALQRQG